MGKVFVLDTNKRPLNAVHPGRARMLLKARQAAVFRRYPFTIILKREVNSEVEALRPKIDPGSKTTGLAIVEEGTGTVVWAGELEHRGDRIKQALLSRSRLRRSRRNRKTRYRKPRFNNRTRPKGWLPPSLMSRVHNIETWARRLRQLTPITAIAVETARFDTQALQNPEISGTMYQQGTLYGYEVRECLLEKWGRKWAYCGKTDLPLQVEHIVPRVRGGSDRVSNLTLACHRCNQKKGSQTADEFGYPEIQKQAKRPLKDAAAINATRWKVYEALQSFGLPVETGTGGQTKYNRFTQGYPKAHWIDAACVGESGEQVRLDPTLKPLQIKAAGHGNRRVCNLDEYGFPKSHKTGQAVHFGFKTGEMVRAKVPKGKYAGTHVGRITIRKRGGFKLNGVVEVWHKRCTLIHRKDGYDYGQ